MSPAKRAVIYTRVVADPQTTEDQLLQLRQYARRMGFEIRAEISDQGTNGGKGKADRPGFRQLCTMIARREVDLVASWAVDRLCRSLPELVGFLQDLRAKQIDLFLHQQALDTSTPSGRDALQLVSVFGDLERSIIAERIRCGLERARREGRTPGRPSVASSPTVVVSVRALRERGMSIHAIAKALKIGVGTTAKILAGSPPQTYPPTSGLL
jgi:DNA invertase Pin-like site-specific DNA recombinase